MKPPEKEAFLKKIFKGGDENMGFKERMREGVHDRLKTVSRVWRQEALPDTPVYPVHPRYYKDQKPHLALNWQNLVKALACGSNTTFAMWPEWPVVRGVDEWEFKKIWVDLPDRRGDKVN